jgi:hypothetical protein
MAEGSLILHNGVPYRFRDNRQTAFEAARFVTANAKDEIIEISDQSSGIKLVMFEDGRDGVAAPQRICPELLTCVGVLIGT